MTRDHKQPPRGGEGLEWTTVRYRTLALAAAAVLVLGGIVWALLLRRTPPTPQGEVLETGARFASIEGSVQVKRYGTLEWIPASRAIVLRQKDLVKTGSGGTAEIHFADGTVFNVRPESLITVEESTQNTVSRQQRVGVRIQSGAANFTISREAGSTRINTPTVTSDVARDTAGSMQVTDRGDTGLKVFRGGLDVQTTTGQKIALKSNEGVQVDSAGAAGSKTSLPSIPQLTAPPNQTEFSFPDLAQGTTLLLWSAVPGATGYRVMVDYSPSFARPLRDRQGHRGTQIELRGLDAGTYYWKVAAVDGSGAEGGFSDMWRFTLSQAAPAATQPPVLRIDELVLKGNVLHVRGRTEPGSSLLLNGERLEVQPDGSFNEFLTFEGSAGANVLLRSTGPKGGVAELRRTVAGAD